MKYLEQRHNAKSFFTSVENGNTGIYYRTIYLQNIQLTIQDIFNNYMNKLIEFNENLDTPIYRSSILEYLQQKSSVQLLSKSYN